MAEIDVNGKKVTLAERLPAAKHFAVPRMLFTPIGDLPFDKQVGPLVGVVESWEFAGDPNTLQAWGELDAFTELVPLWNALADYWLDRVNALSERQKN